MDKNDAAYHMKRCVDSGLWVADASDVKEEEGEENTIPKNEIVKEEPVEVKSEVE